MNITILTYGSRGDVQPFLPLSLGLLARGHSVKLAAPSRFKSLVEGYGIPFVPLAGEPQDLSRRFNEAGFNFIKQIRGMMDHAIEIGLDVMHQTETACQDADLIIHSFSHAIGAHTFAREMNIPDIHIQTFPMFTPTGDYPNVTMPDLKLRSLNRLTHTISQKIAWWISKFGYEQVRRRAGLPKRKLYFPFGENPLRSPTPILCAWSPNVLPPSSDWTTDVHVTGYYFFDSADSYQPSDKLRYFLDAGEPPICVSFGSMVNRNAGRIDRIVNDALRQMDQRAIILSGWSEIKDRPGNDVIYIDAVPHDWLLPKCNMIVHHGGAGTTSAGLRAGLPNVVVPFTADQPFWGRRVHALGVGPRPIPVKNLSVEMLTRAIAEAGSNVVRERAQTLGQRIRGEDGVQCAVSMIESQRVVFRNFKV
ncbi:MAG: glycosyltransferase [Anaerolineales bacterium]|nr:glycosyltransferase family 1 protein [Anaerolineae bacterium]PWB73410.1 MAG: glycosyltransferase [Anaerolineales bacterium]